MTAAKKVDERAGRVVNLARPTVVHVEGSAQAEVDEPTRDFLVSLGWTPPEA